MPGATHESDSATGRAAARAGRGTAGGNGRGAAAGNGRGAAAGNGRRATDELARVQVELAAQAAVATPLSELVGTGRDVSRVEPLLRRVLTGVLDLLEADMGAVWVADPVARELYPVAWTACPTAT